jgi:hypothetical protein
LSLDLITNARRPYLILNLVYYGLIAAAMAYAVYDTSLQQALAELIVGGVAEGPLQPVLEAYTGGRVLLAIGLTFGINLVVGSFLSITLPSLIIPFSGLLVAGLRAVLWGLLFSPQIAGGLNLQDVGLGAALVLLLILEGQGYVLAMLGAYLHGRAFLWPRRAGLAGHRQGYVSGLRQQGWVYLWVALVLLVAAVYEVWLALAALPGLE